MQREFTVPAAPASPPAAPSVLYDVCAWCQRVRDGDGTWRERTLPADLPFGSLNHTMCPTCEAKVEAEITAVPPPAPWRLEGTGGNCTALVWHGRRADYYVVSAAAPGTAPTSLLAEPVTLSAWTGEDEQLTDHANATAAFAAARHAEAD